MNIKNDINFKSLKDINPIRINHGEGLKYVFLNNENLQNNLTQIAFGQFEPDEKCNFHIHQSMDEYFYFINGMGKYYIEGEIIEISPGTFLEIKAGKEHMLIASGLDVLEFIYWGVAI